jgi:signal peptidase I
MTALFRKKDKPAKAKPKKSHLRDWTEALIVAAILALIIRSFIVQAFKIPSGSMEDTLLIGDHLLVNKFVYGLQVPFSEKRFWSMREPKTGDIIVFEFPEDHDKPYFKRRDFIKRVIGTPGDKVAIRNKQVYLNGKLFTIPEQVYKDPVMTNGPRDNMAELTVPPGKYFVMGDNRDRSFDSRFWGYVDASAVKGLAFIKYWSWDHEKMWPRWERVGRTIH